MSIKTSQHADWLKARHLTQTVQKGKGAQPLLNGVEKFSLNFSISLFAINPCQSFPFLTILALLWFIVISLVFFYLCKVLFSGFLQFNSNFVDGQN